MKNILRYAILIIIISTICFACGKKSVGKIEKRGNGYDYLINTSTKKIFRFTIKATKTTNDTLIEYFSYGRVLAPGAEYKLGEENYTLTDYNQNVQKVTVRHELVGQIEVGISELDRQEKKDDE